MFLNVKTIPSSSVKDGLITEDENLSNNVGQFEIYIGRLAIPVIDIVDSVFTFDNVSLDATSSVDPDGGEFRCEFSTFSAEGVEFNFWEDDCIWEFNWSDDGDWPVDVYVIDDENDPFAPNLGNHTLDKGNALARVFKGVKSET